MKKKYDEIIDQHYRQVAEEHGLSANSTMVDEITRASETDAIVRLVGESLRIRNRESSSEQTVIMDIGCGNGYTLEVLLHKYPGYSYVGIEKSDELRSLGVSRFEGKNNVKILKGDIRERDFTHGLCPDILICQRVLINLLDIEDQRQALNNILNAVNPPRAGKPGSILMFLESFIGPLQKLNEARDEFDLVPISPAHHNLYLPDDFFEITQLKPLKIDGLLTPPNFLSTHYYVTRVLHPTFTKDKPVKRNSEFVKFFSSALNQFAGDYSPLKLFIYEKS